MINKLLLFCLVICTITKFSNGQDIKKVHVTFMNHLDIGFNHGEHPRRQDGEIGLPCLVGPYPAECGFSYSVINVYFDWFFPEAINTAQKIRELGISIGFKYTTHPWLLSLYFNCTNGLNIYGPIHCPNETAIMKMKKGILEGYITWHAFPFNLQSELMDERTYEYGSSIAHQLDLFFGFDQKKVMSQRFSYLIYVPLIIPQRDVPGLTQGAIPILRRNKIEAISIGANEAVAPSPLPKVFIWKLPDSSIEEDFKESTDRILTLYHPFGYGGITLSDCVTIENFTEALCMAFKGDNRGPQNVSEVLQVFQNISLEFPNAEIVASSFDAFVNSVMNSSHVMQNLPVISNEIGDTWMYGVPSDPLKVAKMRAIQRERSKCISEGKCSMEDQVFRNFTFLFYKVFEHTWGMDVKNYLNDWTNWSNENFRKVTGNVNYQTLIESWIEQRVYFNISLEALSLDSSGKYSKFYEDIQDSLNQLIADLPSLDGFVQVPIGSVISTKRFELTIDIHGSIGYLYDIFTNKTWASGSENFLGRFQYDTFDEKDYQIFLGEYLSCFPPTCYFSPLDFGKPGVEIASPNHTSTFPMAKSVWMKEKEEEGMYIIVELEMKDEVYHENYGAPELFFIQLFIPNSKGEIHIEASWFNKTATRLPESIWMIFRPITHKKEGKWRLNKIGYEVDPLNVIVNGSKHLHGIDKGVVYSESSKLKFHIDSLDACLVSPGKPLILEFINSQPELSHGVAFNLFNNLYDSNYIMWFPFLPEDANSKFRFKLDFS